MDVRYILPLVPQGNANGVRKRPIQDAWRKGGSMEVKPSLEDLLPVIYQYYHPGSAGPDGYGVLEEFNETPEQLRLQAARKRAGYEADAWLGLLRRLRERFPACDLEGRIAHLQAGGFDAAYRGRL